MTVDEAGHDVVAGGVDGPRGGRFVQVAHSDDDAVPYTHVGVEGGVAGAVQDEEADFLFAQSEKTDE